MAGDVVNIGGCSPLKQRNGLTENYHAICHYSYNLPLVRREAYFLQWVQIPSAELTVRAVMKKTV